MFKKILISFVCLGLLAVVLPQVMAEDSVPVTVSGTAIIQSGCNLILSPLAVSFTVPVLMSVAEDGTFVAQTSAPIQGQLIYKFISGHRAELKCQIADPWLDGSTPLDINNFKANVIQSVNGTPMVGPAIAVVDQQLAPAPDFTSLWVSLANNGAVPDLVLSYKFKKGLLMSAGTVTWKMVYQVFDIV